MSPSHDQTCRSTPVPILPLFRRQLADGLALLLQASLCARDARASPWDFGVAIAELHNIGVSDTILRWLAHKGAIQHRIELPNADADERTFGKAPLVKFTSQSVLVLTEDGYSLADQLDVFGSADVSAAQIGLPAACGRGALDIQSQSLFPGPGRPSAEHIGEFRLPYWDAMRKELWFQGRLVKRFRLPAPNQETILMAFQEVRWPARIDDPLPLQPNQVAQGRLRNTISALNRSQINCLITFHGDGTGVGVLWDSDAERLAQPSVPG